MKKFLIMTLVITLIVGSISAFSVYSSSDIKVIVKDEEKVFDQMPVIIDGRTLVPMRGIFESLGAPVYWDDTTKTVTAKKSGKTIALSIGEKNAVVDGEIITLDVAPEIINGRTMVPVRFVSEALGEKVGWDADTRTVTVGKGKLHMAEIKNPVRRPVPATFSKSNNPDDIIFYEGADTESFESAIPDKYDELISPDDLLDPSQMDVQLKDLDVKTSIVGVDGSDFTKALRVEVNSKPEKDTNVIFRFNKKISGMKNDDVCLITFRMRCVEPIGDSDSVQVKVQVEHPETYAKALFESFGTSDRTWKTIYMVFKGIEGCENVGIRFGYGPQIVEVGDFTIKNFGQGVVLPESPSQDHTSNPDLLPGAKWREDAFERIEKIRKGDFGVIVKDKDGNVIPDAEVELDMFDHQFEWGCIYKTPNYPNFEGLFNATVSEGDMKWGLYKPEQAMKSIEDLYSKGIRYVRGHSIIFEKLVSAIGNNLVDPRCKEALENKDKEMMDSLIRNHMNDIMPRFDKYISDWDVENEMMSNSLFRDVFGEEYVKEIYDWAREADPDGVLYYNETTVYDRAFKDRINMLLEMGVDIDAIGIQSHIDNADRTMGELREIYDWLAEKGFRLKVTEFSCGNFENEILRASYMRDFMINMFSHEAMDGFYMWGVQDGRSYSKYSLFYDEKGNRKPCLDQYEDLVYNKWWTRDAKSVTDKDGKASVRGYYGDYDVTVSYNGNTKTVQAAFHKGYNNVLEIVLD